MTNGEYFVLTHPNVEVKENGTCVWIYNLDNTNCNHYTMPMEWWNEEMVDIRPSGKWINGLNGTFECSRCGIKHSKAHFCPNCGAQMER